MSQIYAKDWYVRPAGGTYGSENGTSYENAWDGLNNVVWGASGIQPGDSLWVCGLHIYDYTGGYFYNQLSIISGTSETSRITVRGDYPGDSGIIWGAYKLSHESWIDEGNNTYSITLPTGAFEDWFFEDVTANSWTVLAKANSLQNCKDTPGSHYSSDYAGGSRLYIHCSDNGNPAGRILANRRGWEFAMTSHSYITSLNLKFYSIYSMFHRANDNHYVQYVRWQGCTIWYGEVELLGFKGGSHHVEVIDCDLAWAGIGLGNGTSDDGGTCYAYTYSGNTIHDIGVRPSTQNTDAHGIGIQGGHDGLIEKNTIYN
jgi:hypothetical protein